MEKDTDIKRKIHRRDFLKIAAATGVAAFTYWQGKPLYERFIDAKTGFNEPQIPNFPHIPDRIGLPEVEDWDASKLEAYLKKAVSQSLETQRGVLVELPEGEIEVNHKIMVEVPQGALIMLAGQRGKSRLRLAETLSQIPRSNLVEFTDVQGEVRIEGIDFDGGSERAGKGGYEAPPDPWDAVVVIRGGQGEVKGGKVVVTNCRFANSESVGLVTENLNDVNVLNIVGKNVDGAWTANWCRRINGRNIIAENCLSDGLYIVECQGGSIETVLIRSGRQGVDVHGSDNLTMSNINVLDCGLAFVNSRSLRSDKGSRNIRVEGFYSRGCGYIFSLGYLSGAEITRSSHDDAGKWFSGQDFMHKGVEDYEAIKHNSLYIDWASLKNIHFRDVQIRKATWGVPGDYKGVSYEGITYYNFGS